VAFLAAAKAGDVGKVREMLAAYPDLVHAREEGGERWTALHMAAEHGHLPVVRTLIAMGADVNADKYNTLGIPLHCASWWGHTEVVRALLAAGSNVNAPSWDRRTPLHYATGNQHVETARLLVEGGADVRALNQQGHTPLQYLRNKAEAEMLAAIAAARRRS
jgi:ankyrin repeat protein